ncbi:hypothetical protein RUM43_009539 [Polyplax serrata]|uniref:Uncharacterized protein n=1 Tax=Polyplax serrata TaxID=468196 RepID=A0AAN8S8K4_POLSC
MAKMGFLIYDFRFWFGGDKKITISQDGLGVPEQESIKTRETGENKLGKHRSQGGQSYTTSFREKLKKTCSFFCSAEAKCQAFDLTCQPRVVELFSKVQNYIREKYFIAKLIKEDTSNNAKEVELCKRAKTEFMGGMEMAEITVQQRKKEVAGKVARPVAFIWPSNGTAGTDKKSSK